MKTRHFFFPSLIFVVLFGAASLRAQDEARERALRHGSIEWQTVKDHLPSAETGTPEQLEVAGDVLRARRMPEDALDFYRYALNRGGDESRLMNRIGVTELELHRTAAARIAFKRVLQRSPKNAEAWNNLGATDYVDGNFSSAIFEYRRALKINRGAAIYHSNLGTAYFEKKDYDGARKEFTTALKLDPGVFQRGGWGGVQAHVMSPADRGRFCFEMATMLVRAHDEDGALLWLGRASEAGFDIRYEMNGRKEFDAYRNDARVLLIVQNTKALHARLGAGAAMPPALAADGVKP